MQFKMNKCIVFLSILKQTLYLELEAKYFIYKYINVKISPALKAYVKQVNATYQIDLMWLSISICTFLQLHTLRSTQKP